MPFGNGEWRITHNRVWRCVQARHICFSSGFKKLLTEEHPMACIHTDQHLLSIKKKYSVACAKLKTEVDIQGLYKHVLEVC